MTNANDIKLTQLFQIEHRRSRVPPHPGLYTVNYNQSKLQTLKGAWSSAAGYGAVVEAAPIDHGSYPSCSVRRHYVDQSLSCSAITAMSCELDYTVLIIYKLKNSYL